VKRNATTNVYSLEGLNVEDEKRVDVEPLGYGLLLTVRNVNLEDSATFELSTISATSNSRIGGQFVMIVYGESLISFSKSRNFPRGILLF